MPIVPGTLGTPLFVDNLCNWLFSKKIEGNEITFSYPHGNIGCQYLSFDSEEVAVEFILKFGELISCGQRFGSSKMRVFDIDTEWKENGRFIVERI